MPHDVNGRELAVGDRVIFEALVTSIYPGADACNAVIQSVHPIKGISDSITVTAGMCEYVPGPRAASQGEEPAAEEEPETVGALDE